MSIIDDIQEDRESTDELEVDLDGIVKRKLFTDVFYASKRGWWITVNGVTRAIALRSDGKFVLHLRDRDINP